MVAGGMADPPFIVLAVGTAAVPFIVLAVGTADPPLITPPAASPLGRFQVGIATFGVPAAHSRGRDGMNVTRQ